jgi:TRAP-type transport system periplasmic protein
MIDRRTLMKAAAASVAVPALPALAQNVTTLRFHTFVPATSNVWSRVIVPWMGKIEKESNGRIKFEGFTSMQMGGAPAQLYDQARDGVVDIVWSLAGYTPGRFPRSEVIELPFFTYDGEGSSKAAWEYLTTYAPDEFKDVKVLAFHTHGLNILHNKRRVVAKAADLRGLKMRGPTRVSTQILSAVGATAVGMPLPQIPDALSKGVIDGCVIPWEVVPSVKVHELTKFHSEFDPAGGALYTTTFVMAMNRNKYASLPADLKAVIDKNSGIETSGWLGKVQQAGDGPGREQAVKQGNTIYTIPAAEAQEFRRKARLVEVEWVQDMDKRGFNGKQLLETAKSLIAKHGKKA